MINLKSLQEKQAELTRERNSLKTRIAQEVLDSSPSFADPFGGRNVINNLQRRLAGVKAELAKVDQEIMRKERS